jgi:hypothetical protein
MIVWLAIAIGFSGFTALWRAMEHPAHVPPGQPAMPSQRRKPLRIAGWVLLIASFALCWSARGGAIGTVLWLGTLTASAVLLVFGLLPYRPRVIKPLAWGAPVLALLLWSAFG